MGVLNWLLGLFLLLGIELILAPAGLAAGITSHHHPIIARSPLAQQAFDQGLLLTYGFNHAAALQAFEAAIQADPDCALCYWGVAYALGPNINATQGEDRAAGEAIQQALRLTVSPRETAYIQALAQRYSRQSVFDRTQLNTAYANAMRQVVQQYPDDLDAATLFAEALMDTTPWDYWQPDGTPKPVTQEILATLDSVLQRQPNHPGALHFYIHAVEQQHPEWAIAHSDRLRALQLPLGHLAHMPSHIDLQVGRYAEAIAANQRAIALDQQYVHQQHPQPGIYTYAYMPHNHHFLWYAAMMAGQQAIALQAAWDTAAAVDPVMAAVPGYGTLQHFLSLPLYTLVQFGLWDQILAQPAPPLLYPQGVWHYARGMAQVARGEVGQAQQELAALEAIAASPELQDVTLWEINPVANLLQIGSAVLTGKLAAQAGQMDVAIRSLQQAVELEDGLKYDEPPPWASPTRQSLAALLVQAGRIADAIAVYQADLQRHPNNVWSVQGLAQTSNVALQSSPR